MNRKSAHVMRFVSLIILVSIVLAISGCAGTDGSFSSGLQSISDVNNYGTVTGVVKGPVTASKHGVCTVEGALVSHNDGDTAGTSTETLSDGSFSLTVPEGTHELTISRSGMKTVNVNVTVEAGKTVAVSTESDGSVALHNETPAKARWTVMFYCAAHNNLDAGDGQRLWHGLSDCQKGLFDLKDKNCYYGLQGDTNVLVFYHPDTKTGSPDDPDPWKRPGITLTAIRSGDMQIGNWKGNEDSGSTETLKEFVRTGFHDYPAETRKGERRTCRELPPLTATGNMMIRPMSLCIIIAT